MPRPLALAALVLAAAVAPVRADDSALGSMRLPLPAAELAAAVGIHRVDPSTLPLDIVRLAFASPDNANVGQTSLRAKLTEALARREAGEDVPLPLSARTWRERILGDQVRDDDLAARIFARRQTALLYHGLLAIDRETLAWIERNPAVLRSLLANAGTSAVFAEAIRIRGDAIVTPGDDARAIWAAVVGADPSQPAAFIERLLTADGGAVAAFYHTVARLDPARQAFAIGSRDEPRRVEQARELIAASRTAAGWSSDRPFVRADIDLLLLLRTIAIDERGRVRPPAARALWSRVFGEGSGDGAIDAPWLARHVLGAAPGVGRRRLETLRFAQQVLGGGPDAPGDLASVLREQSRFPLLLAVLETFGERDVAAYAAVARAADATGGDEVATSLYQAALAILDRSRRSGSLTGEDARALSGTLAQAAIQSRSQRAMTAWIADTLVPALRRPAADDAGDGRDAERVVLEALAGRPVSPPVVVRWEDSDYVADVAPAELRRLTRIRRRQAEMPLDAALARARSGDASPLANSLVALVYACALGDPDGAPSNSGPVWRRHRFRPSPWRVATEVFAPEGWYLAGSLLRLDLALAPLGLRRIDTTEMPATSHVSTSERRTLAMSVALIDPQQLTDAGRDAIATALSRGGERLTRLIGSPADLDPVADDAALSGWRRNAVAWLLGRHPAQVAGAFTLVEQLRLGGSAPDAWGAAAFPVAGCVCLRQPDAAPWEDHTGRASTGQLASQFPDVILRTAEFLARRRLPALLARDVTAFAMQDAIDRARTSYFDDWLPLAFAARELPDSRFADYVAALTAGGPLIPRGGR